MLDKKIINSSLIYVITKYFNLFLGFLRTTFVAITLSKNNMGELVIIYLHMIQMEQIIMKIFIIGL